MARTYLEGKEFTNTAFNCAEDIIIIKVIEYLRTDGANLITFDY